MTPYGSKDKRYVMVIQWKFQLNPIQSDRANKTMAYKTMAYASNILVKKKWHQFEFCKKLQSHAIFHHMCGILTYFIFQFFISITFFKMYFFSDQKISRNCHTKPYGKQWRSHDLPFIGLAHHSWLNQEKHFKKSFVA